MGRAGTRASQPSPKNTPPDSRNFPESQVYPAATDEFSPPWSSPLVKLQKKPREATYLLMVPFTSLGKKREREKEGQRDLFSFNHSNAELLRWGWTSWVSADVQARSEHTRGWRCPCLEGPGTREAPRSQGESRKSPNLENFLSCCKLPLILLLDTSQMMALSAPQPR